MIFRLAVAMSLTMTIAARSEDFAALAKASGTPDIPGLKIVWLAPWGDVTKAHPWRNIIVHQTEGPAGSARQGAIAQSKDPARRGVMVWVETDGTVYWAVSETLVTTAPVARSNQSLPMMPLTDGVAPVSIVEWPIAVTVG